MMALADLADDAPRRRSSPPCVALQASECKANPSRAVQYTLVPHFGGVSVPCPSPPPAPLAELCVRPVLACAGYSSSLQKFS